MNAAPLTLIAFGAGSGVHALPPSAPEIAGELVRTGLGLEFEAGEVVADMLQGQRCIFLAGRYRAERLRHLAGGTPAWPPIDAEPMADYEGRNIALGLRRAGRTRAGLGNHHPQEPGLEAPGGRDPATTQHDPMLQQTLIDTAVTRGKRPVVQAGAEGVIGRDVTTQGQEAQVDAGRCQHHRFMVGSSHLSIARCSPGGRHHAVPLAPG